MTLPSSGAINLGQVNTELGLSSTAAITLNDTAVRQLARKPSGAIGMSDLYSRTQIRLTISANTQAYVVYTAAGSPAVQCDVILTINSGIYVYGTSAGGFGGLDCHAAGWVAGSRLYIINNGIICGYGGSGGYGGTAASPSGPFDGTAGGYALYHASSNLSLIITNGSGLIGGGGGGGAPGAYDSTWLAGGSGGGGGRGGPTPDFGSGGAGSFTNGFDGTAGSLLAFGTGGASNGGHAGAGGDGGDFGQAGGAGGNSGTNTAGNPGNAGNAISGGLSGGITWISGNDGTHVKGLQV